MEARAIAQNVKEKLLKSEADDMEAEIKTIENFVVETIAADFFVEHPLTLKKIHDACNIFAFIKPCKSVQFICLHQVDCILFF